MPRRIRRFHNGLRPALRRRDATTCCTSTHFALCVRSPPPKQPFLTSRHLTGKPPSRLRMLLGLPLLAVVTLVSQVPDSSPPPPPSPGPPPPPPTSVDATRAAQPPVIDGRDDDAAWREARPIIEFQEWRPSEGGPPKLPTVAKVAYDAANLYVFVRAFDPHPDSIITVLARRDYFTPSDMIWLFLDSYHDRRTGFEFGVNPSGVKLDAQMYNDGNEDFAWDAVWDVATRVDSLGWTAEFRIPLSQLPYG